MAVIPVPWDVAEKTPSGGRPFLLGRKERVGIAAILGIHTLLLAYCGWIHSPVWDEVGHLPAGVAHWQTGVFDLYRVNPPLVRGAVTAMPYALGARLDVDGASIRCPPWRRMEFPSGSAWIRADGLGFLNYLRIARLCAIPFSLLAGGLCYAAARALYGIPSAFVALLLWSTSPLVIGHGSLITPDVAAAATAALAVWTLSTWVKSPSRKNAALAGVGLGLALLTKFTNILLCVMPLALLAYRMCHPGIQQPQRQRWCLQVAGIGLLALYLINLGYGFERFGTRLGEYSFVSTALAGPREGRTEPYGNRFHGTIFGRLPVPLPENYLMGIDVQKSDFEKDKLSYLRGEWKRSGWLHYYVYGFVVKEPLGTLVLLIAGLVHLPFLDQCVRRQSLFWLGVPTTLVFALASSQTGLNHHFRYVLPAYPFLFVLASAVAAPSSTKTPRRWTFIAALLVVASAIESLSVFPHSMSFFNRAVGGPANGPQHLLNSNIDWGQDLLGLAEWAKAHPEARPLQIVFWGGFNSKDLPLWHGAVIHHGLTDQEARDFAAGKLRDRWIALSINAIFEPTDKLDRYRYFRTHPPDAMIGYSIYIYDLTKVPN